MQKVFLIFPLLFLLQCGERNIDQQIAQLKKQGQLERACELIRHYIQSRPHLGPAEKEHLRFEAEKLRRLPVDYSLNREQLLRQLQSRIRDFRPEELDQWEKAGRMDTQLIEGEKKYFNSSCSNLFCRYPEIRARRTPAADRADFERAMLEYCRKVKKAGTTESSSYVLPQRFRATMHLQVKADVVPAGETVRCWLPYPRLYPFQTDMRVVTAEPPVLSIDQPFSDNRCLYLEKKAEKSAPVDFKVQFEYTSCATSTEVDPGSVKPYGPGNETVERFTAEKPPHLAFTPELRRLAAEVAGGETDPYLKARRIYDWVAHNIVYSYTIEYSLIDDLSMFAYRNRYGDCGVMGMMFIALCRISGVPARWQGCWMFSPEDETIHDWAEFYVEPYGWLPCDPYMGTWAVQEVGSLSEPERQFLLDFYFGNITASRMAANADYSAELHPPKLDFRSDRIDFQRGEAEWNGHNIYFNERTFEWKVEEAKP